MPTEIMMAQPLTFWERLFPPAPWPRRDGDPRTFLSTTVRVHMDWKDRLRLLATGALEVKVTTYTDVLVNAAESLSSVAVITKV